MVNDISNVKGRNSILHSNPTFYVFNAEDNGGFVIVSSDDAIGSVIGYSTEGSFNFSSMHPALGKYLDFCTLYLEDVENGEVTPRFRASETPGTIIVDALCKTQWGQGMPFNQFCPDYSPCGCVATAMSQIMKYWGWPNTARGKVAYNSTYYKVLSKDLSTSTYNWSVMSNYGGVIRNQEIREAMALVAYDAGLSVKMDYSPSGSGATDENARVSLPTYFKYKASTIDLQRKYCYSTQKEWMNIVKQELVAGRPILYCAQDSVNGGHAFIVDGFDSNDFVHVNWGWDGDSNGFYNIATLAPDDTYYQFSEMQSMIIGIQPDYTEKDTKSRQYRLYMEEKPTSEGTQTLGLPFMVDYNYFYNMGYDSRTYTLGIGLYDSDANFIKEISTRVSSITESYTQTIPPHRGYSSFSVAAKIDEGTPDGKYALRCVCREGGYDEWILPDMEGGSELNWIPILIKGGKVYLSSTEGASFPTDLSTIKEESKDVLYKEYYDLNGNKISLNEIYMKRGVVIERQHLSDGTVKVTKVLK